MKTKIEINSICGSILFEFKKEDNTIKDTLIEANLRGANLYEADLRGDIKIKKVAFFTGLYKYLSAAIDAIDDKKYIKLGCHTRTIEEWESDFWNNPTEFPNDGSENSKMRVFAYETCKKWFEITEK